MKILGSNLDQFKELADIKSAKKLAKLSRKNKKGRNALYSAAILNNLNKRDPELGIKFLNFFETNLVNTQKDNKVAIKPSAHQALNDLVKAGELKFEDLKQITKYAWKLIFRDLAKQENKSETAAPKSAALSLTSSSEASSTQSIEAPNGFLWKPVADSPPHGLAILLPSNWTGLIEGLLILDPENGQVIASGQDGGVGNGDRQHFRFKNQGADFPPGSIVRVQFKDGTSKDIVVANTSARVEGRAT